MMKTILLFLFLGVLLGVRLNAQDATGSPASTVYGFEQDEPGKAPAEFIFVKSDSGKHGSWIVKTAADAPGGKHVLVQVDADRSEDRFLMAIAPGRPLRDVRISVRCKAISGERDQACGVVFRYQDARNYYVARSNALEDNVRLYHVRGGKRSQIASWDGEVSRGTWHQLAAEATGDRIRIFCDTKLVLSQQDRTFPQAGAAGLWVKADSVTAFDEVTVTALGTEDR